MFAALNCQRGMAKNTTNRFLLATIAYLASMTFLLLVPMPSSGNEPANLKVRIKDADNAVLHRFSTRQFLQVPAGFVKIQVLSDVPVFRMRLSALNADCPIDQLPDMTRRSGEFRLGVFKLDLTNVECDFLIEAWHADYQWAGEMRLSIAFDDVPPEDTNATNYPITQGTARSAEMDTSSPIVAEPSHGVRVYCGVSHFSYDDPVVHPAKPGAAHLHMFWGNTASDAFSTVDTLFSDGLSSCEGGINNNSSYWMPALFDEQDQAVLPESVISYYKSFAVTSGFDRYAINPIPNGLQMLANQSVKNSGAWNFTIDPDFVNGQKFLSVRILFPNCLSVNGSDKPVLKSANNISHLAYADGSGTTSGDCPASHPYRMPQLSYNVQYNVPYDSKWYLSSDKSAATQGDSLHADYIAAWDDTTMNKIVQCNREMRQECEFVSNENGQLLYRNQLAERFQSADGDIIYSDSTTLAPGVDRTPFGDTLKKHSM